jgi:hypothetical protein
MTSLSHGEDPEFESQRAHSVSPDKTLIGFNSENVSRMSLSITLEAVLPVFSRIWMVSSDNVR